jgi:hypothetical protein
MLCVILILCILLLCLPFCRTPSDKGIVRELQSLRQLTKDEQRATDKLFKGAFKAGTGMSIGDDDVPASHTSTSSGEEGQGRAESSDVSRGGAAASGGRQPGQGSGGGFLASVWEGLQLLLQALLALLGMGRGSKASASAPGKVHAS